MAHKGYIRKALGDPLPKKGGRSKTYFKLTPEGIRTLKDAITLFKRMWKDVNEYSLDEL
jgi:hypothetical protein